MAKKAKRPARPKKPEFIEGLTVPQTKAVQTLLRGGTTAEAAKSAGVCRTTVSAWLNHDPMFSGTLKRLKTELLESTAMALRNEGLKSVRVLAKVRDDNEESASVRIRAATELLRLANLDARVEWPVPYSLNETMAFGMLMNRVSEKDGEDRLANNRQVRSWFRNSPKGKRLTHLTGRCHEDQRKLDELEKRYKRLYKVVFGLPRGERKAAPEYELWHAAEEAFYKLLRPHQKRLEEMERLRAEEKALEAQLVTDPDSLARDQVKLAELAVRAGADWLGERLAVLGRSEGVADLLIREYERQQFARIEKEKREYEKRINPFGDDEEEQADDDAEE